MKVGFTWFSYQSRGTKNTGIKEMPLLNVFDLAVMLMFTCVDEHVNAGAPKDKDVEHQSDSK